MNPGAARVKLWSGWLAHRHRVAGHALVISITDQGLGRPDLRVDNSETATIVQHVMTESSNIGREPDVVGAAARKDRP